MRLGSAAAAICVAMCLAVPAVRGEQLQPTSLPAAAKWVIHIDVDAARDSKLWQLVQDKFIGPRQAEFDRKVNALESFTGMKFPRDLHDVTLYGPSYEKNDAVVMIHAAVNQAQITDALRLDPEFHSDAHNDHDVLTWRDKGKDKLMYGSFFGTDRVIIAPTPKLVETALDTLDKKGELLKADAPLVAALAPVEGEKKAPSFLVYIAGRNLDELHRAQPTTSPMVSRAESGWLGVGEADDKIVARAGLRAVTEKSAQQIAALANGMRAMLALAAASDNAAARTKAASTALDELSIHAAGQTVSAELSVPLAAVRDLMDAAHIGKPGADRRP